MELFFIFKSAYLLLIVLFSSSIVFAFFVDGMAVFEGLWEIALSPDILIVDYIAVGGFGAAVANASIVGLMAVFFVKWTGHKPSGIALVAIWLAFGFAFFGKNFVTLIPIVLGGYFYALYAKRPYSESVPIVILGSSLSPAVSQIAHIDIGLHPFLYIIIGSIIGILIGFCITPVARHVRVGHEGYNLYNVGFAAGIIAIFIMAVYRHLGMDFYTESIWSEGYNTIAFIYTALVSVFLIVAGFLHKSENKYTLKELLHMKHDTTDFFSKYNGKTYVSMGVLGIVSSLFVLMIGGDLTGPALGGVFSVVGFACFGKRLLDILYITIGTVLAGVVQMLVLGVPINDNGIVITMLFATCLSPFASKFKLVWGIIAGFFHLSLATNLSFMHGGMNLYNNGFAAGLVVMFLLPIVRAVQKDKS